MKLPLAAPIDSRLHDCLELLLQELGGQIETAAGSDPGFDFVLKKGAQRHLIAARIHSSLHKREMRESIAYQALMLQRAKQAFPKKTPLWSLHHVRLVTEGMEKNVAAFLHEFSFPMNVVILDEYGNSLIFSERGELKRNLSQKPPPSALSSKAITFSPLEQWLLKFLLLNGAEDKYWPTAWNFSSLNTYSLSSLSGASQSSVHNFLTKLEAEGYLERSSRHYEMKKVRALISRWAQSPKNEKRDTVYLTPLYPDQSDHQWWERTGRALITNPKPQNLKTPVVLSGGMGAYGMGLGFTSNPSIVLHALLRGDSALNAFLSQFDLRVSEKKEKITLVLNPSSRPVLDIANERKNYKYSADILQVYFDCLFYDSRGPEQAAHIMEKALEPLWRKRGWSI